MLILTAAQSNYSLQHCVTILKLRTLFANTVRFFEAIAQPPRQVENERALLLQLYLLIAPGQNL